MSAVQEQLGYENHADEEPEQLQLKTELKDMSLTQQVNAVMGVDTDQEFEDKPMWQHILEAFAKTCIVLGLLYIFLCGLDLMGTSFKILGGRRSAEMFSFASNPIAGLMIGIFATVLVQSSSTTTSIVVSLVAAGSMSVNTAVPVVMGANIGTSVTNTLVSMVHAHDPNEFKKAFAGATVHDFFNILVVVVLLPIEAATGMLEALTGAMVGSLSEGGKFKSPTKHIVNPFMSKFLKSDKSKIKAIATCSDLSEAEYIEQECDKRTSGQLAKAGFLADMNDAGAGAVGLVISLIFIIFALLFLVKVLNHTMKGRSARIIKKALNMNAYLAMMLGAGVTVLVQSSSITTSTLVPLVGVGAVTLEKMFPFTLGANLGTTVTALLAAIASGKTDGMQIALCHLFFNIFGILIWYPIPFMRAVPLFYAKELGMAVAQDRKVGIWYTATMFFIGPAIFLGLSIAGDAVVLGLGIPILLGAIGFSLFLYMRVVKPELVPEWCCIQPRTSNLDYDVDFVLEDDNDDVEMAKVLEVPAMLRDTVGVNDLDRTPSPAASVVEINL